MDLEINIGTPEQQELIRSELHPLLRRIHEVLPEVTFGKVIIADDFTKTVNSLQATTDYKSVRIIGNHDITVLAKFLDQLDPPVIVLSPILYGQLYDTQVRLFVLIHELLHAFNRKRFPLIEYNAPSEDSYLYSLNLFFDEYSADRDAYRVIEKVFSEPSDYWLGFVSSGRGNFMSILLDPSIFTSIKNSITSFRFFEINVNQFWEEIKPYVDGVFISLAHIYAHCDQYPEDFDITQLHQSPFIDHRTEALMEFIRSKYDKREYYLSEGMQFIKDQMELFGFRMEDRATGPYLHVLDI